MPLGVYMSLVIELLFSLSLLVPFCYLIYLQLKGEKDV